MKKYIITTILSIIVAVVSAQGNLQFNRVVNSTFTFTPPTYDVMTFSSLIVVPAGKVLKIESASVTQSSVTVLSYRSGTLTIGGQLIWTPTANNGYNLFPIWLSEGTYDGKWDSSSSSLIHNFTYSAIEFNIVP